jgi:hypothetical protein
MLVDLLARLWRGPRATHCPCCEQQQQTVKELAIKLGTATGAQRALCLRLKTLEAEQPEIARLYFTKAGDAERALRSN